jgi:RHS repeat-associated protein
MDTLNFNTLNFNHLYKIPCYGFNGKEKDPEGMGGGGSTYDYGFRIYNPQIAKFLSVDPLSASYPWYTPYQFAGNKPIICLDLDGLEEWYSWQNIASTYNSATTYISKKTDETVKVAVALTKKVVVEAKKIDAEYKIVNRGLGVLKVAGGLAEATAGVGLLATPEPTCVTKVVGYIAVAHGSDVMATGLLDIWYGEAQTSVTSQAIQATGVNANTANTIDVSISMATTLGGAYYLSKVPTLPKPASATSNGNGQNGNNSSVNNTIDETVSTLETSAPKTNLGGSNTGALTEISTTPTFNTGTQYFKGSYSTYIRELDAGVNYSGQLIKTESLTSMQINALKQNLSDVLSKVGNAKTAQSLQNQLKRPRWQHIDAIPGGREAINNAIIKSGQNVSFNY